MRKLLITVHLTLLLALTVGVSNSRAETVHDPDLGFMLKLPTDFVLRRDFVGATPDIVHAFQYGEATEGDIAMLLLIEKLGGTIGRERLSKEHMPQGFKGENFVTTWQGFEIDGSKVSESVNGLEVIAYNVQIPLKREAIQVKLFGPVNREEILRTLLRQVLDGLEGESNWSDSAAPRSVADSENYRVVLLSLCIVGVLAGLGILLFVSRRSPKGTVLAIAAILYSLSWQFENIHVRDVQLLVGMMRMLGFAGGILGVVDLL